MSACNAVAMQRGKTPMLMTQMTPTPETARALLEIVKGRKIAAQMPVASFEDIELD